MKATDKATITSLNGKTRTQIRVEAVKKQYGIFFYKSVDGGDWTEFFPSVENWVETFDNRKDAVKSMIEWTMTLWMAEIEK